MRLESLRQPIALVRGHNLWSRYVIIVTDETKSNVTLLMTKLASSTDWSRRRLIAYWVITVLIATECLVGGMMGALRLPPFIGIMEHLGYPAYFMTIIGVWYMLAGVALLAPRFPRLKEWAYAGLVFNYTGAAASHLAVVIPPSRWWPQHLHRPRGRFLGPASIGSPHPVSQCEKQFPWN